jgi:hypothetical protein
MARERPIALRLKAFVRTWVRAERSRGAQLAAAIDRPQSWVTEYVEDSDTPRWADLDTANAICMAIGVRLSDFIDGRDVAPPPPLTPAQAEAAEVAALWPDLDAKVRGLLKGMMQHPGVRAAPPAAPPVEESDPASPPAVTKTAGASRRGTRR